MKGKPLQPPIPEFIVPLMGWGVLALLVGFVVWALWRKRETRKDK